MRGGTGLPDLACPTAAQFARRSIAAIDDAQQVEKLSPQLVGPAAIVSEPRNRTHERKSALLNPEVGLKPPILLGPAGYRELLLDPGKGGPPTVQAAPCLCTGRSGDIIRPENCSNVWLKPADPDGPVHRDATKSRPNRPLGKALIRRLPFEVSQPRIEVAAGGGT